jgi:alcohol dehydrogenase (NADP+)
MPSTLALSMPSPGASLAPATIERRALRDDDVRIQIAFTGLCHTDLHLARDVWGNANFPMVPGHEITGIVTEVGAEVTKFSVGDRVGVGIIVNSCGVCANCRSGNENYCTKGFVWSFGWRDYDGTITLGGLSQSIVVREAFVFRIPDGLGLDVAAPLLCAGVTMYAPLKHWHAGPGTSVAIVGMGGVGHMGIKIAAAMGAEVTVLGRSPGKRDDALRFGAVSYADTTDPGTFGELASRFDLIINTAPESLDIDAYLSLLRMNGTLVNVGAAPYPVGSYNVFSLVNARRSIAGTAIGSTRETQETLDFCAEHQIAPEIETIPVGEVPAAWEKTSQARYRYVADISTLNEE